MSRRRQRRHHLWGHLSASDLPVQLLDNGWLGAFVHKTHCERLQDGVKIRFKIRRVFKELPGLEGQGNAGRWAGQEMSV